MGEVSKEEEERRADKWRADVVGGILVVWVVVLVSWVLYFHFTTVLPNLAPSLAWRSELWWAFHLLTCLWLFQGGTASYFSSLLTLPGYPERFGEQEVRQHYAHLRDLPAPPRGEGFSRWCTHCQQPKFGRTHHCKYCNTCVLKMDHHCPWIWNCVGQNNHRHFFLFVVYVWLSSFYGALNVLPFAYDALYSEEWTLRASRSQVMVSTFLNVSTVLAVSILLVVQGLLISTGQTSVEWQVNRVQKKKAKQEGRLRFILLPSLYAPPPLDESVESHYAGV